MVDDELRVGKPLGTDFQEQHPPGACDEYWQAVCPGGLEQPVTSAVPELRGIGRGEDDGPQRFEAGRLGQRFDPALDPRIARVHPHQEGEPLRMAQRRGFGVRPDWAKGTVRQSISGLGRPVPIGSLILVE